MPTELLFSKVINNRTVCPPPAPLSNISKNCSFHSTVPNVCNCFLQAQMKHSNTSYNVSMPMQLVLRMASVQRKKKKMNFQQHLTLVKETLLKIYIYIYTFLTSHNFILIWPVMFNFILSSPKEMQLEKTNKMKIHFLSLWWAHASVKISQGVIEILKLPSTLSSPWLCLL